MKKNNDNSNILWWLAAIGLAVLIAKSGKNNTEEEQDAENLGAIPPEYKKVGRINMTIAKQAHIKAGDIVVHPNYIRHIELKHGEQLAQLGINATDFIKQITKQFCQIRKGSKDSILLVVKSIEKYIVLALQPTDLIDDQKKTIWEIHTSYPADEFTKNQVLLWQK